MAAAVLTLLSLIYLGGLAALLCVAYCRILWIIKSHDLART